MGNNFAHVSACRRHLRGSRCAGAGRSLSKSGLNRVSEAHIIAASALDKRATFRRIEFQRRLKQHLDLLLKIGGHSHDSLSRVGGVATMRNVRSLTSAMGNFYG